MERSSSSVMMIACFLFMITLIVSSGVEGIVSAPSAQEYLGRYQFYRGWSNKRRLLIVSGKDSELHEVRKSSSYGYRCEMAVRNMNLVLLGEKLSQEIFFFPQRGHTWQLYKHSEGKFWAILVGYDGGLKISFEEVPNFWILFDRVDKTRTRQVEAMKQERDRISCSH
ncbi:unnamed protein product [Lepeophtheirus salmonis]|uniref:(salmon louse) hypothetical protein n=1 Tax=Lepeophtheirus salmonis TaxID=72036 RepID=A0A7R8D3J2_LEPSM|nr:unnamed protein product [Lepeophtheirus salmonis]CAF3016763.1 unnamed protein product [Lepeophtheirus salmonis]